MSAARRVLVLQGGGALGSYQAGVYEALSGEGLEPEWVAGISIGAVNAALIAGNPPERRVEALREFWRQASAGPQLDFGLPFAPLRAAQNQLNAAGTAVFGVSGFFSPRTPPPQFQPPGTPEALSYYDSAPLKKTLEKLVDFDRINGGAMRFSVGAVNVETGNLAYFDNRRLTIGPEHVMASGALPPGLPPVIVDGQAYWDGGLVSNTPLDFVLDDHQTDDDLLVFQVDLFAARGPMPRTLLEVSEREMDIRYSSRTRQRTDQALRLHRARRIACDLLAQLPPELAESPAAKRLADVASERAVTVVHLIYRQRPYEGAGKDFEFSRATMLEHWAAGGVAVRRSLERREAILKAPARGGMRTFDIPDADKVKEA